MNLRTILLLICLIGLGLVSPRAHASTTCTTIAPDIVVAGYDGTASASANTNVAITCTTNAGATLGGTVYVTMCLYIGNMPRQLKNGTNALNYDLYTQAGTVWQGPAASPPASQMFTFSYSVPFSFNSIGSGNTTRLITATIPAQTGLAALTYTQSFAGTATSAEFRSSEPDLFGTTPAAPTSCKTGGTAGGNNPIFPFNVTANIAARCVIKTATDLAFGTVPGLMTAPQDQTSVVTLNCTSPTAWNAGLNNGTNASGTQRRMGDGAGNYVNYELYRDGGRSSRWGNTIGTDTAAGTGTGQDQSVIVYGRVPTQTATPGNYNDTILVTVTY